MKTWTGRQHGFTIVELLIVIVVIAILAAITIVAYNGIQARAQDSVIKQGAEHFAKALMNWHTLTGKQPSGGYGSTQSISADGICPDGSSLGWVSKGRYVCTFEEELIAQKLLPSGYTNDLPPNKTENAANGTLTLMLYPCVTADNSWAVLYYLNSPSSDDTANYNSVASKCTSSNLLGNRNSYGMQGAQIISLN